MRAEKDLFTYELIAQSDLLVLADAWAIAKYLVKSEAHLSGYRTCFDPSLARLHLKLGLEIDGSNPELPLDKFGNLHYHLRSLNAFK